jgi:hypothetical protein
MMKNASAGSRSLWTVALSFVIPKRTRISYFRVLTATTYVVLIKEKHMQLTEAAILDRKSGVPEFPTSEFSPRPLMWFSLKRSTCS